MGRIGGKWHRLAEERGRLIRRRKELLNTRFRLTSKHAEELATIEVRLLEIQNEQATRGGPGSSRWKKRQPVSERQPVPGSLAKELRISTHVPAVVSQQLIINQPDQSPATPKEEVSNE